MIGYEFEFLVREGDRPLSKATFLKFHEVLHLRGWTPKFDPGTGGLVGSEKDGVSVTIDDATCIMELNMLPKETIAECDRDIRALLFELQAIYTTLGASMIGLGVFPGPFPIESNHCEKFCTEDICCDKSYIKYFNAERFPGGHHALFAVAAHQVWLDVPADDLLLQLQVFNALTPLFIALFGNGPVLNNQELGILEGRDQLWRTMIGASSIPGEERRFGMPSKQCDSIAEYFCYILDQPFYFTLREGKGVKVNDPNITYRDFFLAEEVEGQYFDGTPLQLAPTREDFFRLQQQTFPHVRIKYRIKEGIELPEILAAVLEGDDRRLLGFFERVFLECRALSAQPLQDISAGPALVFGVQKNLATAQQLTQKYPYEFWMKLYDATVVEGLGAMVDDVSALELCKALLAIAGDGQFLAPLSERISTGRNPAVEALQLWKSGGLAALFQARDFS